MNNRKLHHDTVQQYSLGPKQAGPKITSRIRQSNDVLTSSTAAFQVPLGVSHPHLDDTGLAPRALDFSFMPPSLTSSAFFLDQSDDEPDSESGPGHIHVPATSVFSISDVNANEVSRRIHHSRETLLNMSARGDD
jgi:hypothetical protein